MTLMPPTACRVPFCSGHAERGSKGYCPSCLKLNLVAPEGTKRPSKRKDEDRQVYDSAEWRFQTRPALLAMNPQCQALINGVRCTDASKFVHHLRSPKTNPEL